MRIEQYKNKQFEQHLSEGKKMAELGLQCRSVALLALCVFISIITVPAVEARTRYYKWEVKYEYRSPDCYKKLAITINGITPGPTILAQQGDTIVVELKNGLLTENTVVHWHGIRQIGTPWSDGTEGVTQCPIAPGETFRYQFVVDRPGTYMYHSHYGMQRELGLYGSIQVSLPDGVLEPFAYDYDQSIILADWYHKSPNDLATGLSSIPFVWVGDPQALLIQGRGRFNCSGLSSDVCNATNPECSPHVLTVIPGKTYRLRIASLTSLSVLSIEIEGHNMTVVEADGHNVDPLVLKNLYINSGETYSVLIKADQDPSRNYWLTTNVVDRESTTPTGLAIFNYKPNDPQKSPPTVPTEGPFWNDRASRLSQSMAVKAHKDFIDPPPRTPDRVIQLLNTINQIDGRYRWALNNISLTLPQTPYLVALKDRLLNAFDQTPPPDVYDLSYDIYSSPDNINTTSGDAIYRLGFNTTVDIILQNANSLGPNLSDTHPWHLHGHDFWVLGYGEGKFNLSTDTNKYNLVNPIKKNTVVLHPYAWTALRFRADNPGVWSFHCHVEPHLVLGMMVVFEEGVEKVGRLPSSVRGCGKTKGVGRP